MVTERAGLRACWMNSAGAERCTICRARPAGTRTRQEPSISAPAFFQRRMAASSPRISMPISSRMRSACRSMSANGSSPSISYGGMARVMKGAAAGCTVRTRGPLPLRDRGRAAGGVSSAGMSRLDYRQLVRHRRSVPFATRRALSVAGSGRVSADAPPRMSLRPRGQREGAVHQLEKGALFAQDEALRLRERKIFPGCGVLLQARPIGFVSREGFGLDESPSDMVGAFVRQKVADQIGAAAGNDALPVFGVGLERGALKWIDVVADEADDAHGPILVACVESMVRLTSNYERRSEYRPDSRAPR